MGERGFFHKALHTQKNNGDLLKTSKSPEKSLPAFCLQMLPNSPDDLPTPHLYIPKES